MEQIRIANRNRRCEIRRFKIMILLALMISVLGTISFVYNGMEAIVSIGVCVCLLISVSQKIYIYMLPPLIMFYEFLVIPGGLSVFRIYSLGFIFLIACKSGWKYPNFGKRRMSYLLMSALYLLITVYAYTGDIRKYIFLVVDILFMATYTYLITKGQHLKWVGYTLIIAVLFSCLSGAINNVSEVVGVYVNGTWTQQQRLLGTFTDPNYLSIYINLAIFFTLIIKDMPLIIRVPVILGLYFCLLATCSTTGVLANVLGVSIYLFVAKKINLKTLLLLFLTGFALYQLYYYAIETDMPFISDFIWRMTSKFQGSSNVDTLTTDRSALWREHWAFFKDQNMLQMLLGGNNINAVSINTHLFRHLSHEEYLDLLLTYGIIGSGIILIPNIVNTINTVKRAIHFQAETDLFITMSKFLYFFYAFGLTMNFDYKFMLFILL